jgi:TetR/AcrR family transcriptional regulator
MTLARWKSGVPSRTELRDAKRDAVLREASASFNKRGFHGTSLDDVAQRLGVTKAALYYYFANKQAVLKACFDLAMEVAFSNVDQAKSEGTTGRDKLRIVLAGFLEYIIDEQSVNITMMEEDALSPEDMASVKTERTRFEHEIREFVREGVKDGSIIPCDPKLVVMALLGALNWVPRWFKPDGQWSRAELGAQMIDLLERMISADPAEKLQTPKRARASASKS